MTDRTALSPAQQAAVDQVERYSAHNYLPLPVVIESGQGAWVTDVDGNRYLDFLAAYSAVNFGHGNPELLAVAHAQLDTLTLTSRAFFSAPFGPFVQGLAELCRKDMVLTMNTGVEAVESGIKVARKWGYEVKGVRPGRANIIVMEGNFHGRTTTVVSFSDDRDAREDFGPYTPGFRRVRYGDAAAIAEAIDADTVAVLLEPIQGEAGIIIPPAGYLQAVRDLCTENRVLMIADEIQSGLGRSGATFYSDVEGVVPDMYLLGKALGGGIMPVSAVVANADILGVLRPGQHGSTFGGNPLACAIGLAVVDLLKTGVMQERSRVLGARLADGLRPLIGNGLLEVRGAGLWVGIDVDPELCTGRELCYLLMRHGILAKDTHGKTVRLAPPLVVTEEDIDQAVATIAECLAEARASLHGRPA